MKLSQIITGIYVTIAFYLILSLFPSANALTVRLDPSDVDRAPGNKVRINLWVDGAVNLISMGVKVSYDTTLLRVIGASKYEDVAAGWVLTDGQNNYTDPAVEIDETNPVGFVKMIGGHFTGAGTVGHSGSVLLGWIDFQVSDTATGSSDLTVELAQDSPNFLHFVNLDGTPDEPSNIFSGGAVLSNIYVGTDACEGDMSGDTIVNLEDFSLFRFQFGTNCSLLPPGQLCAADFNGDGLVNLVDFSLFREDFGRNCQ